MGKCCLDLRTMGAGRGPSAGFLKIGEQIDKIYHIEQRTKEQNLFLRNLYFCVLTRKAVSNFKNMRKSILKRFKANFHAVSMAAALPYSKCCRYQRRSR